MWGKGKVRIGLSGETEEWLDEILAEGDYAPRVVRGTILTVDYEINGNLDAIGYVQSALRDLEEACLEGNISPQWISIAVDIEPEDKDEEEQAERQVEA